MSNELDLDQVEELVAAEARADQARIKAEKEAEGFKRVRDTIREQLARLMGDHEVGLIRNQEVLRRVSSNQFAHARFRDENPDLYEQVKTVEIKDVVDREKLAAIAPEVYAKYLGTRWTNTYGMTS